MGFFEGFLEGFAQTSANTILKQRDIELQADAERKKALATLDVQSELEARKAQIKMEAENEARKRGMERINQYMGGTGGMTMSGSNDATGTNPLDIDNVFAKMQQATKAQAAAQAAGDTEAAQFFNTQVDSYKQQMEYIKNRAALGGKPVTGAEGSNIVTDIQKQLDDETKVRNSSVSQYFPQKLNKFIHDPSVIEEHKKLNQEHQALAQAVANAKRESLTANTPEVASTIKRDTQEIMRDVNTLRITDSRITDADKRAAAMRINKYFDSMSPVEQQRIEQDPNFQRVFTPDVMKSVSELSSQPVETSVAATPKKEPVIAPKEAPVKEKPKAEQPKQQQQSNPLASNAEAVKIRDLFKAGKISRTEATKRLKALQ